MCAWLFGLGCWGWRGPDCGGRSCGRSLMLQGCTNPRAREAPLPPPSRGLALDVADKSRTTPSRCCCPCCAGRPNPWAEVYGPSRAPPAKSLLEIADEGLTTTLNFAERVIPKVSLSYELEPDSGAIVQKGLHKVWS